MKKSLKMASTLLLCVLIVTIFAVPAEANTLPGAPLRPYHNYPALSYNLEYDSSAKEMIFNVKNNYYWPMYLTFPTGKKFDLAVFNSKGQKMWQYSDGKFYTQAVTGEWIYGRQEKSFHIKLPELAPGEYNVKAFFHVWGSKEAVASARITIKGKTAPGFKVDAWYRGGTQPYIVLALNNQTKQPVMLEYPTAKKYEVVIMSDTGYYWQYSKGKVFDQAVRYEQLGAGVYRSYYIYLPDKLPKGNYTAYVYYLASSYYDVVKTIKFSI